MSLAHAAFLSASTLPPASPRLKHCNVGIRTVRSPSSIVYGSSRRVVVFASLSSNDGNDGSTAATWQCMKACGACCFLGDYDNDTLLELLKCPADVEAYLDMIGEDGWCRHFDKQGKRCAQYSARPSFCRVDFDVFQDLYGVQSPEEMNSFAIQCCEEHISGVYPSLEDDTKPSEELQKFRRIITGAEMPP